MGNCINPASKSHPHPMLPQREDEDMEEWCFASPDAATAATTTIGRVLREDQEEEEEEEADAAAGVKVKVVLKRAELEWLMAQLKTGDRRLEDI
uniref:Uncharacterized protein n=1 Tax=Leersia perrieri TaxID=77586 RepID=A0A0D9WQV4_9ORYZ